MKNIFYAKKTEFFGIQDANKQLNKDVDKLQSEVEKYHKTFEDTKKERDCRIAEYQKKIEELENRDIAELLPEEPIKVADMLINAQTEYENNSIFATQKEYTANTFSVSELRQIAEHLLVYCNHNGEVEE